MSGKANPYDNTMMESFFSTLRAELTELEPLPTRKAARTAVFEFIEVFYNRQRLHSSLGYRRPTAFEAARYPEGVSCPSSIKPGQAHSLVRFVRVADATILFNASSMISRNLLKGHLAK